MWIVKVGHPIDGNEFASPDAVNREEFADQWESYRFTKAMVEAGWRVNVYEGMRHIGTFESGRER